MIKTLKVAISLPKGDFQKIEKVRKRLKLQRSAAIDQAIQLWLKTLEEEEKIRQYERGYLKYPESLKEITALGKTAVAAWADDDEGWS